MGWVRLGQSEEPGRLHTCDYGVGKGVGAIGQSAPWPATGWRRLAPSPECEMDTHGATGTNQRLTHK